MDNPSADPGIFCIDFEPAFDVFDCEGADDFVIPAGETWTINQVDVLGEGLCDYANVRIYADDAGMPGVLLFEHFAVPSSNDGTGNLIIEFPETELTEGTYWLSVQANMNTMGMEVWAFGRQAPPLVGSEYFWRCPLDGWGNGATSWTTGSVIHPGTGFDLSFELSGFLETAKGTITENTDDLLGYNVYLDGVFVENTTDLFWQYTNLAAGQTYMGGVSSVWDEGESAVVEYEFTVVSSGYSVSGTVTYANAGMTALENCTVELHDASDALVASTTTDATGYYAFPGLLDGDYTIVTTSSTAYTYVTNLSDLNVLVSHLLGTPLVGIYYLAGEVSGDGIISLGDYNMMVSNLLGTQSGYPDVDDWKFEVQDVTISGGDVVNSFEGIMSGDTDGSWE
jgi:hypothetical protein